MIMRLIAVVLGTFLVSPLSAWGSLAMEQAYVNRAENLCARIVMGDECTMCRPPAGWEEVGSDLCPAGYRQVDDPSVCAPIKNQFCCSANHSGSEGDCRDVVVNASARTCVMLENLGACPQLPSGWTHPESGTCPLDYRWVGEVLDCQKISGSAWKDALVKEVSAGMASDWEMAWQDYFRVLSQDKEGSEFLLKSFPLAAAPDREKNMLSLLEDREAKFPQDMTLRYLLGVTYARLGRLEQARQCFEAVAAENVSGDGRLAAQAQAKLKAIEGL